ncbi:MAG: zinc ribbon domain-containing protein [Acidobacteria bacterium]|nr:zinc ribbon domain-containing protein [Acidobacteriota bacterium]
MPIFEYQCEDCGTKFEKLVRGGTAVACPSCGEQHLRQEYSTFAARGNGAAKEPASMAGGCGAGMCRTPGLCGRN